MSCLTVSHIHSVMNQWAPVHTAESWDNCGLQIGDLTQPVKSVLVTLELSADVCAHLSHHPVDLVITHHPVLFKPVSQIKWDTDVGQIIKLCSQHQLSVLSYHTNLDVAENGVTDCLINEFGFNAQLAKPMTSSGLGRYMTHETTVRDLATWPTARVIGSSTNQRVSRLGFCGGSGRSLLTRARELNLDVFITGEIGYHDEVWCGFQPLTVITLGHKESEDVVLPQIKQRLSTEFENLSIHII